MKTAIAFFALSCATALAQDYRIDWFTISGGGTSSDGAHSINGAIGQAAAGGPLANGQFSLLSGYWTLVIAVQTPEAPFLSVTRQINGAVTVSWPRPATGWILEQTDAFAPAPAATTWSQVAPPYNSGASDINVTIPAPIGTKFYRLRNQ